MPNFNSISSGVSEPQVAENRYLPLTGVIALTTVYSLTCYTVMTYDSWCLKLSHGVIATLINAISSVQISVCLRQHKTESLWLLQWSALRAMQTCSKNTDGYIFVKDSMRLSSTTLT